MKILFRQLNCSVKLADVSTRCFGHSQGKSEASWNVGKFYRTSKLSEKNLCLFMQSNWERCHFSEGISKKVKCLSGAFSIEHRAQRDRSFASCSWNKLVITWACLMPHDSYWHIVLKALGLYWANIMPCGTRACVILVRSHNITLHHQSQWKEDPAVATL